MRMLAWPLLSLMVVPAVAQDEKVTIEWKFKKGDVVRYEMSQTAQTSMNEMEMKQEMLFGTTMETKEVDEKGAGTIEIKYDRVKVKMSGMMEVEYDSDAPKKGEGEDDHADPAAMMAKVWGAMVGASVTAKMSPKGEILEVKGFDKLMDSIVERFGDDQPGMGEMLKEMYNEDQMKQMMQLSYGILPGKPIGKGDTWETKGKFALPGMGEMGLENKATLKEIREGGKEAVIGMETKIEKGEGDEAPVKISGGKMTSELVWSIERGRLESSKGTMKMGLEAGDQSVEMTMTMGMKITPLRKP
ncbi:MAG: hypothetical protein HYY16_10715 [Planctomycetes bacterium]|nr:hypothetical protein [Planctomycetota bacterium]